MSDIATGKAAQGGVADGLTQPVKSPFAAARNNRPLRILGFVVVFACC